MLAGHACQFAGYQCLPDLSVYLQFSPANLPVANTYWTCLTHLPVKGQGACPGNRPLGRLTTALPLANALPLHRYGRYPTCIIDVLPANILCDHCVTVISHDDH